MNKRACIAFSLLLASAPAIARAATCTIGGTLEIEPLDAYYCDTGPSGGEQSCNGWKETNLDTATKPMKYLEVRIGTCLGCGDIGTVSTDGTGTWTKQFTMSGWSQCQGHSVWVNFNFARVNGSEYRFRVADPETDLTWSNPWLEELDSSNHDFDLKYLRTNGSDGTTQIANVYYTAQSFVAEVSSWSTNLGNQFSQATWENDGTGTCRIRFEKGFDYDPSSASQSGWLVNLDDTGWNSGGLIRHELGHLVRYGLHSRQVITGAGSCSTSYLANVGGRDEVGCEWGYNAMGESLPNFFAVRSITTTDTDVWFCSCSDPASPTSNQDVCSDEAWEAFDDPTTDADAIRSCNEGLGTRGWQGIGDEYSSARSHCARVRRDKGCDICLSKNYDSDCTDGNDPGEVLCTGTGEWCDDYADLGWRNGTQIVRFFWDMIDTHDEGGTYPDVTVHGRC